MTVSVVVAAHNAESTLERAVTSVLDQTWADHEVIVVDDRSADGTFHLARALSRREPRVRALQTHRNGGPSVARNLGFDAARGEWVTVLDADDYYRKDRLQSLLGLAGRYDCDIVADNQCRIEGKIAKLGYRNKVAVPVTLRDLLASGVSTRLGGLSYGYLKPMVRRAFLERTGVRYDPRYRLGEDFKFLYDTLLSGATMFLSAEPTYVYFVMNEGSLSAGMPHPHRRLLELDDELRRDPRLPPALLPVFDERRMDFILEDKWVWAQSSPARFVASLRDRKIAERAIRLATWPALRTSRQIKKQVLRGVSDWRWERRRQAGTSG